MICERCKQQPASVHYTEIINNQKRQMHLCEACAKEAQKAFEAGPTLNLKHFLAGLMGPAIAQETPTDARPFRCESCGLTEEMFGKYGLLGCGECYRNYERLAPLLRRIHGSTRHTGKVPQRSRKKYRWVQEVERLRAELQEAVEKEKFERAAELRDEIRALESRLT
ncbi:MAG: UvrB/UvrC motif-containing protein [Candidatus Desulforudis sp.]|nr:UvrB/UvrC motif-containing protein [Desulforudis sp.]